MERVKLADHGEVWSLPWQYSVDNRSLHMLVKEIRFPYTLEKRVRFNSENSLWLDYTLTNCSPFDFEFLWAEHLMVNMEEGVKVIVPDDCSRTVTVLSGGKGKFGDIRSWPFLTDNHRYPYRTDICRSKDTGDFEKFYFVNTLTQGWCELIYPGAAHRLKVSFPAETVPHLGILMNEGGWDNLYNIIIEPCTVCYDRPDLAKEYGQVSKVEARGTYKWHVKITI
ncbi:MAG: hypothetical protein AB2L20_31160 [Mangrovibacterium sp.]